jgi:formate dehydrogenase major subunit
VLGEARAVRVMMRLPAIGPGQVPVGIRGGNGGRDGRGEGRDMGIGDRFASWPVVRQVLGGDPLGLGAAAQSPRSADLKPRTRTADQVVGSICPYCAVGCGQRVYVQDGRITQIEGDPDSPVSRGRLCPKGSATRQLVQSPTRETKIKYRRPYGTEWEELPLDRAMDMIADRVIKTRREGWQDRDDQGRTLRRTMSIAHLGGATLDNEENYLLKKLYTALGAIQIENQARI